jgi:phenylalanyl-tRNA synthetase beta chain
VGRLHPIEELSQTVRERMVGLGFQELATPVLTHREKLVERMTRGGEDLVEIQNPMTENYAVVRNSLLPTLLEVEQRSYRAAYPHRLFECGETACQVPGTVMGTQTRQMLGALVAHAEAGFAEAHACLDALLLGMELRYRLRSRDRAGLLEGRSGAILVADVEVGWIGEVHPEVLDLWGIKVPCAAFELDLSTLVERQESSQA